MIKQSVTVNCKVVNLNAFRGEKEITVRILGPKSITVSPIDMTLSETIKVLGKENVPTSGRYKATYELDSLGKFVVIDQGAFERFSDCKKQSKNHGSACFMPNSWKPGTRFSRTIKILNRKGEKNA